MEAHPHQALASRDSAVADRMPRPLWGVVAGMVVATLLLIALPMIMMIDRESTYQAIRNDQSNLDPSNMDIAFYSVMAFVVLLHAIDVVLTIWFGLKTIKGKQWARIALTISLVVTTLGSVFSATAVPSYLWVVIPSDTVHIMMLVLLWVPRSVREFFAAHRFAAAVSLPPIESAVPRHAKAD